jgi:thiol-disulfide isomerase/thioredoxin
MRFAATLLVLAALQSAPAPKVQGEPAGSLIQAPVPFEVGSTIPKDITLKDIYGKEHSLGDFRGKIVFIHFWSIVCPYEKLAEPKCIEIQKTYGEKGVVEIAINANQKELAGDGGQPYANLRDHVEKFGVNFLVAVDHGNKLTDMFDGKSTPHCFVIDRDGVLRYAGALDDDPKGAKGAQATAYVRDAIEAVLAGKPVQVVTTKPYG